MSENQFNIKITPGFWFLDNGSEWILEVTKVVEEYGDTYFYHGHGYIVDDRYNDSPENRWGCICNLTLSTRPANEEEIAWLLACRKNRITVEREKISYSPEIY